MTFQQRLHALLQPHGYTYNARRSIQTIILIEAHRCAKETLAQLHKPFQRKAAFLDQVMAIVESLDFLYPPQKDEVLWRTATNKEPLSGDVAWKRYRNIEKEVERLAAALGPLYDPSKTQDEAVDLLVQELFKQQTGQTEKLAPPRWEHSHNHCVAALRLFYKGSSIDPDFPPAVSPRRLVIPSRKPAPAAAGPVSFVAAQRGEAVQRSTHAAISTPVAAVGARNDVATVASPNILLGAGSHAKRGHLQPTGRIALGNDQAPDNGQARLAVLHEVRLHLDLLRDFEGLVPDEDLTNRKRQLYESLPPAPPEAKRGK